MQPNIDFVLSQRCRTLGSLDNPGMKVGTFVGTKNYFFFFPDQIEDRDFRKNEMITTTISLGGLPMKEFIIQKVQDPNLSIDEFEKYALEMSEANKFVEAHPFTEIKQVKLQVNFFAGTITINKTDKRIGGWDPIFPTIGKQKKEVKAFYSTNPIVKS